MSSYVNPVITYLEGTIKSRYTGRLLDKLNYSDTQTDHSRIFQLNIFHSSGRIKKHHLLLIQLKLAYLLQEPARFCLNDIFLMMKCSPKLPN
jgi:hypothetical protein